MKRIFRYFIDGVEVDFKLYDEAHKKEDFIGELSIKIEKEETIESLKEIVDNLTKEIEKLKEQKEDNNWWKNPYYPFKVYPTYPEYPNIIYDKNEPQLYKIHCNQPTTVSLQN